MLNRRERHVVMQFFGMMLCGMGGVLVTTMMFLLFLAPSMSPIVFAFLAGLSVGTSLVGGLLSGMSLGRWSNHNYARNRGQRRRPRGGKS